MRRGFVSVLLVFVACSNDVDRLVPVQERDAGPAPCATDVWHQAGNHTWAPQCEPDGWREVALLKPSTPDQVERFAEVLAYDERALYAGGRVVREDDTSWLLARFERVDGWTMERELEGTGLEVDAPALSALAASSEFVIAGAAEASGGGVAFIVRFDDETTVERLELPSRGRSDEVGFSVAVGGGRVVVGAPGAAGNTGVVYVYDVAPAGASLTATIEAPIPRPGARFGSAVALDGDRLVVGAPSDCPSWRGGCERTGEAFVFDLVRGEWRFATTLEPQNEFDVYFGHSVTFARGNILVGAPSSYRCTADPVDCSASGMSAPIHECPEGMVPCGASGTTYAFRPESGAWRPTELRRGPLVGGEVWGHTLASAGDVMIVGAHGDSSCARAWDGRAADTGCDASGAVHRYVWRDDAWVHEHYVKALDGAAQDRFGYAIAVGEDAMFVGARGEDTCVDRTKSLCPGSGSIYVFEFAR